MIRIAVAAGAVALALAPTAPAARFAVGLEDGAAPGAVAARLKVVTGGRVSREHLALGALTLHAESARGVVALSGVAYVESLDARRRLAFSVADPLAARQWYLDQIRAFHAWPQPPALGGVRVAIVDSGLDGDHVEFANRVAAARSFVRSRARTDQQGHGTFVAGLVAAAHDDVGIAGIAFPAQLAIAKVVGSDPTISLDAEVRAIRWAVDVAGADVINLSLAGLRDPLRPARDSFSRLEASAVDYAVGQGAVVVAAVGNADQAPRKPWPFASYPAALPHVVGVSALSREGSVPLFSIRDRIYNDIAAPGRGILSTFPRALSRIGCANVGYSDCAADGLGVDRGAFRRGEGTSFASPQVAAAAALVLAVRPDLRAEQVTGILTRTAEDMTPASGCLPCTRHRDPLTGWGRLDVTAALQRALGGRVPAADSRETNDDAGASAATVWGRRSASVTATIDFWDDQNDVYRVRLPAGRRVTARLLRAPPGVKVFLWRPGTRRVEAVAAVARGRIAASRSRSGRQQLAYRVPRDAGGWYYLQVRIEKPGAGAYALRVTKR